MKKRIIKLEIGVYPDRDIGDVQYLQSIMKMGHLEC